jgi:N-acetylglucosaminyldiphosphoundecaprenol N-acetyl-beta-D-mannosaminyltransferase
MAIRSVPDFSRPVYEVLGLPFDAIDLQAAVRHVLRAVETREPLFISTPNLNFLIASQSDASFKRSVCESDLSLADGMPVVWLAKLLNIPIRQRVAGSDLFEQLCIQSDRAVRVFFFGGPPGAAQQACEKVNSRADTQVRAGRIPGVVGVGYESPGFGSLDEMSHPDILARINDSGADFVVVALGAKKGQAWIQRNRALLNAPVISHLGAVVNMAAGTIDRAPRWMRRVGLEWIWRIKEEPMLWRRYAGDGIALLRLLLTRVGPEMVRGFRVALLHRQNVEGQGQLREVGSGRYVLRGVWADSDQAALRAVLLQCGSSGEIPRVEVSEAKYLAPSVRGLVAIASRGVG